MARVIHVLTGCTAVGKTGLALRWAEAHGAEIISCDSLLFYRGMDLGTAKPTRAELARVRHHLIDTCDVREQMNVTYYVTNVRQALEGIFARGRAVLVTGGSGFYLKAFLAPVADEVDVDDAVRARVNEKLGREGLPALVAELEKLNPAGLGALDTRNPRRVTRALERCLVTGKTLAELKDEFAATPSAFADCEVRLTELTRDKDDLDRRIETRVQEMLRAGLVDEVRRLLPLGLKDNPSAARAIGYRETVDFLEGRLAESELAPAIIRNTRALVKKQRTWFKTQLPPHRTVPATEAQVARLFG
jgi:tRNA dimethylallyltransferase